GGPSWLNTSTVLERDNFAGALAAGTLWTYSLAAPPATEPEPPKAFDPARLLEEEGVSRPEDIVRVLLDLYLPGGVRPEARAKLEAYLAEDKPGGSTLARRVREAVHAILTMPEYHLA